jgi:hypothetical protein
VMDLRAAAEGVVLAQEHLRDAINGVAHDGPHDKMLHFEPCTNLPGVEHVYDLTGDCAQCGGDQYGAEDAYNLALGDLREALGHERRAWEQR